MTSLSVAIATATVAVALLAAYVFAYTWTALDIHGAVLAPGVLGLVLLARTTAARLIDAATLRTRLSADALAAGTAVVALAEIAWVIAEMMQSPVVRQV
jgi:hypothetical protein